MYFSVASRMKIYQNFKYETYSHVDGVRVSLSYCYQQTYCWSPRWYMSMKSHCGMILAERNRWTRGKPVPVPLCPQIPHGLIRARTRSPSVRGRRLTAWVIARPNMKRASHMFTLSNCFSFITKATSCFRVYVMYDSFWICIYSFTLRTEISSRLTPLNRVFVGKLIGA
jgi:hypothetical protein